MNLGRRYSVCHIIVVRPCEGCGPFQQNSVANSIAKGHAFAKHAEGDQQFRVNEGGKWRTMTLEELRLHVEQILADPAAKSRLLPPDTRGNVRRDLKGNTIVVHDPSTKDQGTVFKSGDPDNRVRALK